MKKLNLAKAVALALSGTALSFSIAGTAHAAGPTTMYNLSTGSGDPALFVQPTNPTAGGVWTSNYTGATDGWTNGAGVNSTTYDNYPTGTIASQQWVGTSGSAPSSVNPFNYIGAHLNWAVDFGNNSRGSVAEVSTYDSFARYGYYADIDTAKGSWAATNTGPTQDGWRHDLDVGLFRADGDVTVTISANGLINPNADYGFTIFKGMDAVTAYQHHGEWNAGNNTQPTAPDNASSPYPDAVIAGTGLTPSDIIAYTVGQPGSSTISFKAQAGQVYTIFVGGNLAGDWYTTTDGYKLTISAVPEPSSLLLIGAAAAGFRATRRKS